MTGGAVRDDDGSWHAEVKNDAGQVIFTSRPYHGSDARKKAQRDADWFLDTKAPKQPSLFDAKE